MRMRTRERVPAGAVIHVVTSFLMRDGKVLVLRRSDKVGTYRGKWAGVSGHLEPGEAPLERALIEISEETGIERERVVLRGEGPAMAVAGTPFVVHPFLFELRSGEVLTDWEHTGSKWVDPGELAGLDTVPALAEAFSSASKNSNAGGDQVKKPSLTR